MPIKKKTKKGGGSPGKGKATKATKNKADGFTVTLNMAKMQAEQNDDLLDLQSDEEHQVFLDQELDA